MTNLIALQAAYNSKTEILLAWSTDMSSMTSDEAFEMYMQVQVLRRLISEELATLGAVDFAMAA